MKEISGIIPDRTDEEDTFVQISIPTTRQILCNKVIIENNLKYECVRDIWHKGECNSQFGDPMMEYAESLGLVIVCPICDTVMAVWESEISLWMLEDNVICPEEQKTLECHCCGMYEILLPTLSAVEVFELEDQLMPDEVIDEITKEYRLKK